ncbi:MAG TPA: XRE family transcriptional regulator [Candidatus Methylacidiphilales bacterium]|nr:XRE family transcriptional regulator [Candidatus Methylacidiphilales bacterium]
MTLFRDPVQLQLASFGSALRDLRQNRGWSLQELASRSGLSKTFLSRLENGDRQASIAAVLTLARIFNVSLASMFETEVASEPCLIVRANEVAPQTANGLTYTPLSNAERFFNLQPIRLIVSPQRKGHEHFHHDGEEWVYLLSGRLTLSLAGKTYDLEPGDAAHFDSRQHHRLIARGTQDAEVLLVASPFPESDRRRPSLSEQKRAIPAMGFHARPTSKNHPLNPLNEIEKPKEKKP